LRSRTQKRRDTNAGKGFEAAHRTYLDGIGLDAIDYHLNTGAEVTAVLQRETDAGRYPLISLPEKDTVTGAWGYHVYVFAKREGKLLFINPANREVRLSGHEDLAGILDWYRTQPGAPHQTIHVLTYTRRAPNTTAAST